MHSKPFALLAALWWLLPVAASASVSLPLEGYCKPGRYFPIRIDGTDASQAMLFSARGCLPSRMDGAANASVILPMLATDSPSELDWDYGKLSLRSPAENERLIACGNTDDAQKAAVIFPNARLIPIPLDMTDPLPGPPAAWETLDAIVLDAEFFPRISDSQRSALLAGGVQLISIGESAPDARWPWRHQQSIWVLSSPVDGPIGEAINANIYAPTYGWMPGWSAAVRGQVVAVGALLVLITIALMLRPNRITVTLTISIPLLVTIGIATWRQSLGLIDRTGGDIVVADHGQLQRDAFVYERAKQDSNQTIPWAGWTHPLFSSEAEMDGSHMQIDCSADGSLAFTYAGRANHTLAFLRREIQPGPLPAVDPSLFSPMKDAVRVEYLNSENRILGMTPALNGRWAGVLLQHK